jgi:hypothetical protein
MPLCPVCGVSPCYLICPTQDPHAGRPREEHEDYEAGANRYDGFDTGDSNAYFDPRDEELDAYPDTTIAAAHAWCDAQGLPCTTDNVVRAFHELGYLTPRVEVAPAVPEKHDPFLF